MGRAIRERCAGNRPVSAPPRAARRSAASNVLVLHDDRAVTAIPTGILRAGTIEVDIERRTVSVEGKPLALTAKEFGVLRMLLKAKGRVLTREVLREAVWARQKEPRFDSRTVDVHVGRLRQKLGSAGRHIVTVRGVGYCFEVLPERV